MPKPFERIESRQNSRFRQWLSLNTGRQGRKTDLILIEGLRLCRDALASGVTAETLLIADSAPETIKRITEELPPGVACVSLPDKLFALLSDTENPQGQALVCHSPVLDEPAGPARGDGLYLVADGIADPGNLGTMIRTADAFAFSAVLLTSGTVWPMNPKVIRAAMGASFHLPLILFQDITAVAEWLAAAAIPLIAADPQGDQPVTGLAAGGAALVIGNEAHGLSSEARRLADHLVSIPMPGRAESLNAAAAAAICAYELMRKNQMRGDHPCKS
ncbi:MAG: RNA methyltransferase [Ruminococcaceae bacterium]|nr:RNA methyltransferase [Oscillospiraceae bacterium]